MTNRLKRVFKQQKGIWDLSNDPKGSQHSLGVGIYFSGVFEMARRLGLSPGRYLRTNGLNFTRDYQKLTKLKFDMFWQRGI